ncbi:MAG: hypothetical protein M1812_002822 [Candelaria pacifica]|nr:MAG: hypothetical protein M1812_002822 [Candelaria pacifica]
MPKTKAQGGLKGIRPIQQPTPPAQDGEEIDEPGHAPSNGPMDKDATEVELEKLIFGDDVGFQESVREHSKGNTGYDEDEEIASEKDDEGVLNEAESGAEDRIEDVDDVDLFFLDTGPSELGNGALVPTASYDVGDDSAHGDDAPAWEDSDDERIMVSLASNPRLRKLRNTEAEDVVNGKEYIKRLRRQFERLYPVPEWANPSAANKTTKKKRRRRPSEAAGSSEESASADDMDIDDSDDELSAQPLANVLRSAEDLTRPSGGSKGKRSKLRPEVLDIQRTKDVGKTQPSAITSLSFHPTLPLLLSSGPASTIYIHQIDPSNPTLNPLLTSLHVRSTPLSTTVFSPKTGSKVFLSGRRRFFHVWDLESGQIEKISRVYGHQDEQKSMERFKLSPCGRWMGLVGSSRKGGGLINILDATTLQWISQARIESRGGVADFEWWSDGEGLCIAGKSGEISEWSISEKRMLARWNDEGAFGTTVISLGGKSGRQELGGDRWVVVGSSSGIINIYDRRSWLSNNESDGIPINPKPTKSFSQLVTAISCLTFSNDGQLLAVASRWKKDSLRLTLSPNSDSLAVGNEQGRIGLWDIRC